MSKQPSPQNTGQRGPPSHHRREQIIDQAYCHFRLYGYRKTSVASLARHIGVSSAYLYRFFESKQGIGQAICQSVLQNITRELTHIVDGPGSATTRLRLFAETSMALSLKLFLNEGKMMELVVEAISHQWPAIHHYEQDLLKLIEKLVHSGRELGEFERRTPLDDVALGILRALSAGLHPSLLELHTPEEAQKEQQAVTQLILRSLMP